MTSATLETDRRTRQARLITPVAAATTIVAAIAVMAALSPRWLLYDERFYMEGAYLLALRFDFIALMTTPLDIAAGPLYPYLHFLVSPLTGMAPPAMRFVNIAGLLVCLGAVATTLKRLSYQDSSARAAMLLAVPMLGPTTGLALTELPALAMACLAVTCVARSLGDDDARRVMLLHFAAGLFAGLAILGRQTYLPGLLGFVALGWAEPRRRWPSFLASAIAVVTIAPMLVLWRGITPPWMTETLSGLAPQHGILAFVYLATVTALIAPRYLWEPFRTRAMQLLALAAIPAALLLVWLLNLRFDVAYRVVAILPGSLQTLIQLAVSGAMLSIAALYALATLHHLRHRHDDKRFLFLTAMTLLLNGTAAGIAHQFSSRYVLVAFPFALLALQPWIRPGFWASARVMMGGLLGLISLAAYYWNAPPTDMNPRWLAPTEVLRDMPLLERPEGAE